MAIETVSLRLQSGTMNGDDLAAVAGRPPDEVTERGSPISSREPSGAKHTVTTAVFKQPGSWNDVGPYIRGLRPIIDALSAGRRRGDVHADVVVAFIARPMGYMIDLDDELVQMLARARCGLVLDAYCLDAEE